MNLTPPPRPEKCRPGALLVIATSGALAFGCGTSTDLSQAGSGAGAVASGASGNSTSSDTGGSSSVGGVGALGGSNSSGDTSGGGGTSSLTEAGTSNGGGAGASGAATAGGQAGAIGGSGGPPGDIAAAAGTPLVAAHSMTRAMYAAYSGKLFQVRRASDGSTQDSLPVSAGGYVDTSALMKFCSGTTCGVSILYDQSGNANDLPQATASSQPVVQYWSLVNGMQLPMAVTVSQQYLRNRNKTSKIPVGAASQTEYFVIHGKFFNAKCCWDYGNMEAQVKSDGVATMSALNFGTSDNGFASPGAGSGPWFMVDYESGVYAGPNRIGVVNPGSPSITYDIVTGLSKTNGTTSWVLKVGDASKGALTTAWNGALPKGYSPLRQEGGLSLGEGGDGSKLGTGAFSEGVVIAAVTSDATDDLIQANITSVYGQ